MLGVYYIYMSVGWYSIIQIVCSFGFMYYHKKKGDKDKEKREKIRKLNDQKNTYTVESLTNIKTLKLYGWEQKFKNKIENLHQEADKLEEEMRFDKGRKVVEFLEHLVRETMNISVFGLYFYFGNTISMTTMQMARMGMGRLTGNLHRVRHLYHEVNHFKESMERLMNFYTAPEVQKNLVEYREADDATETSVRVTGNFSYGVTPCKDYDEKREQIEKQKKKAEKEEEERIKKLPIHKRWIESLKSKPKVKYELEYKPRTMKEISTLRNINFEAKKGEFVIIVGKIQSGKSSLMKTMIGEMMNIPQREIDFAGDMARELSYFECRALEDTLLHTSFVNTQAPVSLSGSVSYVEQQHWIQNATVRDNILFGSEFDARKYARVVKGCQLTHDLSILPAGDLTEIGEKGINLSGGQKARLSLARAVYKMPDILLLDDPISALDAHVRKMIFKKVFCDILKDKTRILITHAVDFVHLADRIIIMDDGEIDAQGTFEDLQEHPYMKEILKIHNENKVKVESQSNIDSAVGGSDGSDADDDESTTLKKIKSTDSSKSNSSVKEITQVAPMVSKLSSVGDGQAYLESISGVKD